MSKDRTKTSRKSTNRDKLELPFANYAAASAWLYDRIDVERTRPSKIDESVFKLDRMRAIMKKLGDPQEQLTAVHIAGTNGKGSTVAMVSSILQEAGYAVGQYTSPHLIDVRERIQINDAMISHHAFTKMLSTVAEACESLPAKLGRPNFFEVMTALAFCHFADQAVDVAVIETGLGGRLDATNVIKPVVTAITGIDIDHAHILGDSIEKIATEKAGIFKEGVPALTFKQDKQAIEAMQAAAGKIGAELLVVGKSIDFSYRFESSPQLGPHFRVGLSTPRMLIEHLPVPLPGEHQALNCGLTLAIIDRLIEHGLEIRETCVYEGLPKTAIPARAELLRGDRRVLLDGAHNPAALQGLIKAVGAHVPYDSMVMVFGCAMDKDVEGMLNKVALGADKVIFTRAKNNARAMDAKELRQQFEKISSKMCQHADTLEDALSIAARAGGRDDLIVITGSFYLVGEARKLLMSRIEKAEKASERGVLAGSA